MYQNTYTNVVKVKFKIMLIYQTNDYSLLQITEKKFLDKSKPMLNKTRIIQTRKWTQTYIDMYYILTKIISKKKIPVYFQPHDHTRTHTNLKTHIHTHKEKK